MESTPLLKSLARKRIIFLRLPRQHGRRIRNTGTTTEGLNSRRRVIEHIVCINNTDLMDSLLIRLGARLRREIRSLSNTRTDNTLTTQILEMTAQLVVPRFLGVEVVEACHCVQGRDRAPVVRWDTVVRVPDQESPVETLLDLTRHHRGVTRFLGRVIWVRAVLARTITVHSAVSLAVTVDVTVDTVGHAVRRAVRGTICTIDGGVAVGVVYTVGLVGVVVGPHTALDASQGGGDTRRLATRRQKVGIDILDKDSLSL